MLSSARVAVVGLGPRGQAHVQAVMAHPDAQLVGVVDCRQGLAARTASQTGARWFPGVQELLAAPGAAVDLAVVAVPAPAHPLVAGLLLTAGVGVLVEKPVAATAWEATMLAAQADAAGVVAAAGHVERFNPAFVALRQTVTAGGLGALTRLLAVRWGPPPPRAGVGVTLDLAIHDLDLLAALLPEPALLRVEAASVVGPAGSEHAVHAQLWHPAGIRVGVDAAWLPGGRHRCLMLAGNHGTHTTDLLAGAPTLATPRSDVQAATLAQLDDVLAASRHGRAPAVPLSAGAAAVDLAEQILQTATAPSVDPHRARSGACCPPRQHPAPALSPATTS